MTNPFINKPPRGEKLNFYFSQFDQVETGIENAKPVTIFDGGSIAECRAYLSLYRDKNRTNCKSRTTISNGSLWVAFVEI